MKGLSLLATLDYTFFFVTNQAGLAEGLITQDEFDTINNEVLHQINPSSIIITQTYVCPHAEGSECDCRKPKPGLLLHAAAEHGINLEDSWMIGDRLTDIQT